MKTLFRKLRWLTHRAEREAELREELEFHLREDADERSASGLSESEAHSAARRELGNVALVAEDARAAWTWPGFDRLLRDLRFGLRGLRRNPGFTFVAVLTLGLAIGATTVMFGVVDGVVLRPLPYPRSEQLVRLSQLNQSGRPGQFSDPNFDDLQAATRSFEAMAEYSSQVASVVAGSLAIRADVASVSQEFFDIFGASPWRGRRFVAEELHDGAPRAAIVSDAFWRRHFGDAKDLASASLRINGAPHPIVGVMPPRFDFPLGTDVWVPREQFPRMPSRTAHNWLSVARIRDGIALDAARTEATAVARRLKQQYGDGTSMTDVAVTLLHDDIVGPARPALFLLLGSVVLLLGVACANLATLLLARIAARRREFALRTALGAKGPFIVIPVVAESLIVALGGGLLGVALAGAGIRAVRRLESAALPRLSDVDASGTVLAFGLLATGLTAIGFAAMAGWQAQRLDLAGALKDGARGQTGGTSVRRLRNGLVIAQLALSVVLLIGAGLLGRSFVAVLDQDAGFRREGALTVALANEAPAFRFTKDLTFELADPASPGRQARLYEEMLDRLRAVPGVIDAGGINALPMDGRTGANGTFLIVRGNDLKAQQATSVRELMPLLADATRTGSATFRVAAAGYFRAMAIPLVRGRLFDERDRADASHVALISESLARAHWPTEDPIGARIQFGNMDGDMRVFTVVGIVGDVRERGLDSPPRPTLYADYRQRPIHAFNFTLVLQTAVPPASVVADARRIVQEMTPDVAPEFRAIDDVVGGSVAGRRFALGLAVGFAAAAMLMAVLGVYGVLSYLVAQRTREFGVRIVLGAHWTDIQRVVLGEAARLVALGLTTGIGLTFAGKRILEGMLFGIETTDVATYIGVSALLVVVAFLACQVPAIRAARVDPMRMLRAE